MLRTIVRNVDHRALPRSITTELSGHNSAGRERKRKRFSLGKMEFLRIAVTRARPSTVYSVPAIIIANAQRRSRFVSTATARPDSRVPRCQLTRRDCSENAMVCATIDDLSICTYSRARQAQCLMQRSSVKL